MTLYGALDLTWAVIGATALAVLARAELRSGKSRIPEPVWRPALQKFLSVFLAAFSLFPCISARDDAWRFQNLQVPADSSRGGKPVPGQTKPSSNLGQQLEALDNFQVSGVYTVIHTHYFFTLVDPLRSSVCERFLPSPIGRAPPRSLLPA